MPQRRAAVAQKDSVRNADEMVPFGETLDKPTGGLTMDREPMGGPPSAALKAPASLSLDARYETESREMQLKRWKEGPFAAGMTAATWEDEYRKYKTNPKDECLNFDSEDGAPCMCCSALVCGSIGAGRIGNMAILKQSTEWVEEVTEDENGETKTRRFTRPKLDFVVGPVRKHTCFVGKSFLLACI
jgi:hypothetical protein